MGEAALRSLGANLALGCNLKRRTAIASGGVAARKGRAIKIACRVEDQAGNRIRSVLAVPKCVENPFFPRVASAGSKFKDHGRG